jgi:hypothetical protein
MLKDQLDLGLTQVENKPVGKGFYDLGVGYDKLTGLTSYAEAGWHATDWLSVYGKGYVQQDVYGGMIGVRGTF